MGRYQSDALKQRKSFESLGNGIMKSALYPALFAVLLDAASPAFALPPAKKSLELSAPEIEWLELAAAREAALANKKPLLVDFWADWCGFCKKLDRETFSAEEVIRFVSESFVAAKVDVTAEPETARQLSVSELPTVIFFSPEGTEVRRFVGYREPAVFLEEARKAAEASRALAELRAGAEKNPQDCDLQRAYAQALLAAGDTAGAIRVLEKALKSCPEGTAEQAALLVDLGHALRKAGKFSEARDAYRKVLSIRSAEAREARKMALLPMGRSLVALKEYESALAALTEFLSDPATAGEERLEALFLRGFVYAVLRDADRATSDLQAARETDPGGRWGLRAASILEILEPR